MKIFVFLSFLFLISCSSQETFKKTPVDQFIIDMSNVNDFTILLHDMDAEEHMFTANEYQHQYKIITMGADSVPQSKITEWYPVSEAFFNLHSGDIGMEIASKVNGKVSKTSFTSWLLWVCRKLSIWSMANKPKYRYKFLGVLWKDMPC